MFLYNKLLILRYSIIVITVLISMRGGEIMRIIMTIIATVVANVVGHYICKWLDSVIAGDN